MKILDRYVLRSFLINYLISFMVLIGMYIVLDMVFNFDELVEQRGNANMSTLGVMFGIADYYFYQSFLIFVHLSGIIPVVAAGFTLIRLSRFNELSAILASGVNLRRVAMPIVIAAVVLQVLLMVDQELIIPGIIPKLTREHDQIYRQTGGRQYPVQAMQDDHNALLFAGRYVPATAHEPAFLMEVDIIERDDQLQPTAHTLADRATWDPRQKHWNLKSGRRVAGLKPEQNRSTEKAHPVYKSNITPDEIELQHSGEYVSLLSRERINQLLDRRQVYGAIDLLRVKHFRICQLVMNIVMILVAIPCLLTRDPGKLKTSIIRCFILIGLCMAGYFLAYQVAGFPPASPTWGGDRWPAIVAFIPVPIFGAIAIYLLDTLPT